MDTQLITHLTQLATSAGGGDGHGHLNWFEIAFMFINAALFFGTLIFLTKSRISSGLLARHDAMAKELEDARLKQADADRRLTEYKNKIENLESEVDRIVSSYESEAKAERKKMEAETGKAIQRLARETEFTIRQETKKAELAIRNAAVAATLATAEKLIKEKINSEDQQRLVDGYIEDLDRFEASAS